MHKSCACLNHLFKDSNESVETVKDGEDNVETNVDDEEEYSTEDISNCRTEMWRCLSRTVETGLHCLGKENTLTRYLKDVIFLKI